MILIEAIILALATLTAIAFVGCLVWILFMQGRDHGDNEFVAENPEVTVIKSKIDNLMGALKDAKMTIRAANEKSETTQFDTFKADRKTLQSDACQKFYKDLLTFASLFSNQTKYDTASDNIFESIFSEEMHEDINHYDTDQPKSHAP